MDDESLNRLIRLRIAVEKTVSDLREKDQRKAELSAEIRRKLGRLGLTEQETQAWIQGEPNFDILLRRPRDKLTPYPLGGRSTCDQA